MKEEVIRLNKKSDVVFVGNKPLVRYIRKVIAILNKGDFKEITLRSRGKFISKAVDVAEVVKRSMIEKGVYAKNLDIMSEHFEKDGKKTNVSAMEIVLALK